MKTSISHIGFHAQQVLERSKSALVSGIASRGIYLQPEDDWTLYLSQEIFKGPLTMNLEEVSTRLDKIKAGSRVQFSAGEIQFPDEKLTILLKDSKTWFPFPADKDLKSIPGDLDSILSTAHKITPGNPYLPLLSENPGQIPGVPVIGERIQYLQEALRTGIQEKVAEGSLKLLGLGPGLTPLGDDFLLGVLLSFNRWGHLLSSTLPDIQKAT